MLFRVRWGRLPLTQRLTLLFTAVAASVVLGLGALFLVETERHFVELDRMALQDKQHLIEEILRNASSADDARQRLGEALSYHHDLYTQVQDGQGAVVFQSRGFIPAMRGDKPLRTGQNKGFGVWRHVDTQFHTLVFKATPAYSSSPLVVWIAADTDHHRQFLDDLRRSLALYVLVAIAICGLLSWLAARQGLAPLRDMKSRAAKVTGQKLGERMPVQAVPVELADLAQELNRMLERLQEDFQRLTEFSSDLAHELRTPISNLLTQTQVTLAQPRDAASYRDTLASNAEEFQRLGRMVSDMLLLAQTQHGLALPHREPVALHQLAQALFDFFDVVAEEKGVTLALEGQATTQGDRLMLQRAISNLLSNAIRHAPEHSGVRVLLSNTNGEASLCVDNAGPPIGPEHLPRLFDRFYRVDKSRAHLSAEGTGLGLAITRAIMEAHGGTVSVDSHEETTRFCLQFPAT